MDPCVKAAMVYSCWLKVSTVGVYLTSRVTKLSLAIEFFALWLGNPRVSNYLRCEAKESGSGDSVRSGTQVGASVGSTDAPMVASMPDEA